MGTPLRTFSIPFPLPHYETDEYCGWNEVFHVDDSEDVRLSLFRLKLKRNHLVHSMINRKLLDLSCNIVVGLTAKVVRRALRGKHSILSVALSPSCYNDLQDELSKVTIHGGILITPPDVFTDVVGIKFNATSMVGVLVHIGVGGTTTQQFAELVDVPQPLQVRGNPWDDQLHAIYASNRIPISEAMCPMLILDDVRSSDNIGVILRVAFSFDIPHIIGTSTSIAALNARSARTSLGALFHFTYTEALDTVEVIQILKARGIKVLGTSPTASNFIRPIDGPMWALVLGNEDQGSSSEVMSACSELVAIPQTKGDSLSVSSAAAISLYELQRNRLFAMRSGVEFIPDI